MSNIIHSLFRLFIGNNIFVFDEKSMISLWTPGEINNRMQQAKLGTDSVMRRLSCILFGDFCQLPAVAGRHLYSTSHLTDPYEILEKNIYHTFNKIIQL
ncbi:hypothetical protein GGS21DRAFT_487602 [Xylaria nigripes]|nr:hypothetical protein GGS21DRAFT_487602 [Xylaria nigripes]